MVTQTRLSLVSCTALGAPLICPLKLTHWLEGGWGKDMAGRVLVALKIDFASLLLISYVDSGDGPYFL